MRLHTLLYFYGRRLRTHPIQELLAGLGIAIGVALTFAVLVANSSITGSAREIVRGLAGAASLQVMARDAAGFDEGLTNRIRRVPGVLRVSPLLEQRAIFVGPNGRRVPAYIAGADPSLGALGGVFTRRISVGDLELRPGVLLPRAMAEALGLPAANVDAQPGQPPPTVSLQVRGRAFAVRVGAVLGREAIGPTADAMAALMSRHDLQRFAGLPGRATRVLIQVEPGQEAAVGGELAALAVPGATVTAADEDSRLLDQATAPNDRATTFFALISALVGLLLAFNAMLMTTPERRRVIAELRIQGFRPRQLISILMFQAAVLGAGASALGLLAGNLLARGLFHETPNYLSAVFPIGTHTVVTLETALVSLSGGVIATCLAAAPPLLDLRQSRPIDAIYRAGGEPGQSLDARARRRFMATAMVLLAATGALTLLTASGAIAALVGLALATLLAMPAVCAAGLRAAEAIGSRMRGLNLVNVAVFALRTTTLRSLAVASTAAVAVFGSVAVGGARDDLVNGIGRFITDYTRTADVWVTNGSDNQATKTFRSGDLVTRIGALQDVSAVRTFHGGFLDFAGRRVWIIARPEGDRPLIPPTQIVGGDVGSASTRLRQGGWVTVSDQIARALGAVRGETLTLPTPTGNVRYRIAATTTNFGWPPGAIVMNSVDYRSAWAAPDPTALEVDARPGAATVAVKKAVQQTLGPGVALDVQTASERAAEGNAITRQGLSRLGQISTLLLIAAALTMAAAMGAAIWQRRAALAALRLQGFRPAQLWLVLLLESGLVLGIGCLVGALAGVYGQALIDRYLEFTTGFPAPFGPAGWHTVRTLLLVFAAALGSFAVPGYLAAHAPARLGLQE
jgi:putative ABC transport system permease protein